MMATNYSIHPASEAERLLAYRNAHEAFGRGLTQEEFVSTRLRSVRHNRAGWWVLTVAGDVVASLACYPLSFCVNGLIVRGIGIGSVHTRSSHRKNGYAASLCRHVAEVEAARGAEVALLFSDIAPAYYERLGYQTCPAWTHRSSAITELARQLAASLEEV
jgi:predicted N-acetyltransferase YhbS